MAETSNVLADQFDDLPQQREASTLGMWTFLATEILFFGGLFLSYIIYRITYPHAFAEASRHTLLAFGTLNTAILLTSSLTMALAVRASQEDNPKPLLRSLLCTIALASAFLGVKAVEYRQDLAEHLWPGPEFIAGLPPQSQIFWFLYWAMTGLHAVHVTIGVGVLSWVAWQANRGRFSSSYYNPIEVAGLYWHFVDVVWIFLYPLFYLANRST